MQIIQSIQNRIYEIRGKWVILDKDLAVLYETETKSLNLAVKQNIKRFPKNLMFQLIKQEWDDLRVQIETSKGRGENRYLPYAFTEQGISMLSGILNSNRTIKINIAIMRAFAEARRVLLQQTDIKE